MFPPRRHKSTQNKHQKYLFPPNEKKRAKSEVFITANNSLHADGCEQQKKYSKRRKRQQIKNE
ncbi:unnamed protein product [Meloidogyne enterolobii]|uniref:Uncharacterized protein n=1 Tax=Meloidogyne enterolobii TaxID=390850 RepID=A0ACB1A486_MELEN